MFSWRPAPDSGMRAHEEGWREHIAGVLHQVEKGWVPDGSRAAVRGGQQPRMGKRAFGEGSSVLLDVGWEDPVS